MIFLTIIEPDLRVNNSLAEEWMFFVFLAILSLLAFVRWSYSKNFSELFASLFNVNKLRETIREEIALTSRASQILLTISFLSLSLFIYLVYMHFNLKGFGFNLEGISLYLAILFGVLAVYGLKAIFLELVKLLFAGDFSLTEYEFNVSLFLKLAGILLIPILLLLVYSKLELRSSLFIAGIVVLGASMLWRFGRGLVNALNSRISIFYIILYLCAFEILPVAVILKVLV